jgi:hypothetical protein
MRLRFSWLKLALHLICMRPIDPHFHMLYLNGVYDANGYFWPTKPPSCEDLDVIAHTIAKRVSRFLEKAGYLVRDLTATPQNLSTWILCRTRTMPWVRSWAHPLPTVLHSVPMLAAKH